MAILKDKIYDCVMTEDFDEVMHIQPQFKHKRAPQTLKTSIREVFRTFYLVFSSSFSNFSTRPTGQRIAGG